MIRVTGYTPQRVNNTSFGNGAKAAQSVSKEVVCPLLKGKATKDVLVKATEAPKHGPYMGGVPKGVTNPEAYRTGPFYLD